MPIESTANEPLTVRYVIDVDAGLRIDEAESMLSFDEYAASIRGGKYCEGAIVLESPGQERLDLNDALPFLVKQLCFRSLRPLSADETVTVPFFMSGVDVVASVDAGQITMELTLGGSFRFEKWSTMNALFDCGRRFTKFYRRLWAADPAHERDVANLARDCAEAQDVLQTVR